MTSPTWPGPSASDLQILAGTFPTLAYAGGPRLIRAFAAPEAVSTERPLLALAPLGLHFQALSFTLRNQAITPVALYIDKSESGIDANGQRETMIIAPGSEGTFVERDVLAIYWAISAAGDPDGGNPSSLVSWSVVGQRRQPASVFLPAQ